MQAIAAFERDAVVTVERVAQFAALVRVDLDVEVRVT